MSIASKEAEEIYPVTNDELSVESIIMDNDDAILQKAYIAGRTAEPTDTEVHEAAKALCADYLAETPPAYRWRGGYGDPDWRYWVPTAKAALLAARKAAME